MTPSWQNATGGETLLTLFVNHYAEFGVAYSWLIRAVSNLVFRDSQTLWSFFKDPI